MAKMAHQSPLTLELTVIRLLSILATNCFKSLPRILNVVLYMSGVQFPTAADALLARAQRRFGGKSTFGLKLLPSPRPEYHYYLRPTPEDRRFLNFRWPCSEYRLWEDNRESGLRTFFSFVRDRTVYQVIRIQPDDLKAKLMLPSKRISSSLPGSQS